MPARTPRSRKAIDHVRRPQSHQHVACRFEKRDDFVPERLISHTRPIAEEELYAYFAVSGPCRYIPIYNTIAIAWQEVLIPRDALPRLAETLFALYKPLSRGQTKGKNQKLGSQCALCSGGSSSNVMRKKDPYYDLQLLLHLATG